MLFMCKLACNTTKSFKYLTFSTHQDIFEFDDELLHAAAMVKFNYMDKVCVARILVTGLDKYELESRAIRFRQRAKQMLMFDIVPKESVPYTGKFVEIIKATHEDVRTFYQPFEEKLLKKGKKFDEILLQPISVLNKNNKIISEEEEKKMLEPNVDDSGFLEQNESELRLSTDRDVKTSLENLKKEKGKKRKTLDIPEPGPSGIKKEKKIKIEENKELIMSTKTEKKNVVVEKRDSLFDNLMAERFVLQESITEKDSDTSLKSVAKIISIQVKLMSKIMNKFEALNLIDVPEENITCIVKDEIYLEGFLPVRLRKYADFKNYDMRRFTESVLEHCTSDETKTLLKLETDIIKKKLRNGSKFSKIDDIKTVKIICDHFHRCKLIKVYNLIDLITISTIINEKLNEIETINLE